MLVVATIAEDSTGVFSGKKSNKQTGRELRVSRAMVRKVIRSGATDLAYERTIQPLPKIERWKNVVNEMLAVNALKLTPHRASYPRGAEGVIMRCRYVVKFAYQLRGMASNDRNRLPRRSRNRLGGCPVSAVSEHGSQGRKPDLRC